MITIYLDTPPSSASDVTQFSDVARGKWKLPLPGTVLAFSWFGFLFKFCSKAINGDGGLLLTASSLLSLVWPKSMICSKLDAAGVVVVVVVEVEVEVERGELRGSNESRRLSVLLLGQK